MEVPTVSDIFNKAKRLLVASKRDGTLERLAAALNSQEASRSGARPGAEAHMTQSDADDEHRCSERGLPPPGARHEL